MEFDMLHDLFLEWCKKYHPDVNPDAVEYFSRLKNEYDSGNFSEFLEHCNMERSSEYLYSLYRSLDGEVSSIAEDQNFKLGYLKAHNKREYYQLLSDIYGELEDRIKTLESIIA